MVERDLAKVEVAGSTPVSRSSGNSQPTLRTHRQPLLQFQIDFPGAVPKW